MTDEAAPGSAPGGAEQARAARAAARAGWPVRRTTLAAQSTATAPPGSTPEQRLAMMWPLALDARALAGRPLPDYPRREAPGRVIRARERGTR